MTSTCKGCVSILVFALLSSACGAPVAVHEAVSIPTWVERTPSARGKLYAVGMVGRTYFPEDGRRNAAEEARKELARTLSSRVESLLLQIERSRGSGFLAEAEIVSATTGATELVVDASQILEYWVDSRGLILGGQQGATYALAIIDLATVPVDLRHRGVGAVNDTFHAD